MTDPINEQISAFVDGELPSAESELLMKRFERDPALRGTVGRYSLIGEALRSTEAGGPTKDFAARVARAIEQESAPSKSWRPVTNWLKPVAGGAIAAGVAAVALVSLRIAPVNQSSPDQVVAVESPSIPVLDAAPLASPTREEFPSETVPRNGVTYPAPPIQVVNSGRLANFVVAHSEYSSPLGRRNVLTSLLADESVEQNTASSVQPDGQGAVEFRKNTSSDTAVSNGRETRNVDSSKSNAGKKPAAAN